MTLKDILESKMANVVKINENETLDEVIRLLEESNVSGVFVVDDQDKLTGIFTERDVVACFAQGIQAGDTLVKDMKRKDVITFDPSTEVSAAISTASRNKMRHLPIVQGETIVGMITYRDLVSYVLPEVCFMAEAM